MSEAGDGSTGAAAARAHQLQGAMIVVVNLVVDLLYAVIDPRIRYER